jgi:hypothetical protein
VSAASTANYYLLLLWLYSRLLGLGCFFSFLILYTVGRTPWTEDQPVARPLPTHRTNAHNTDIRALSGIRTHDPSFRASEDSSCLKPRGHCDRQSKLLHILVNLRVLSEFWSLHMEGAHRCSSVMDVLL